MAGPLKNGLNIFRAYLLQQRIPRLVTIGVTSRCSGTCQYCGSRDAPPEEMSRDEIFAIVDDLEEMGCGAVALTGGDPLLRNDLGELLDYMKSKGLKTCICSDGSHVEERRDVVRKSDYMQLSFDGPPEIHDRQKYQGAYERFSSAREVAKEEKLGVFTLTVITKLNLDAVDFILDAARTHRMYAFFQPLSRTYFYDDVAPDYMKCTVEEFERAIRKLIHIKKTTRDNYIGDSLSVLRHYLNPDEPVKCYGGRLFAYIHTSGDVYQCWTPPRAEVLNCTKVGFRKAFEALPEGGCDSCVVGSQVKWNQMGALKLDTWCAEIASIVSMGHTAGKARPS